MSPVIAMRNHMTEAQYETERAKLRELYGDSSTEAAAKRDQALAILFYRSGWTQEELAAKEGKSRIWIVTRLRFGRFLNFVTTVTNAENMPRNLTERRFRSFWEQTDKDENNERLRFQEVFKLMKSQIALRAHHRKPIGHEIVKEFGDGKWHKGETIAQALDAPLDFVETTLESMRKWETYGAKAENKKVGTHTEYRIFKMDKTISSQELIDKLAPIVKELKAEGKKNMATMAPAQVAYLAGKLQKLLDEWAE